MANTLIIKTGAAGDVVRTTSVLNVLTGPVYWLTSERNADLLPDRHDLHVITIGQASHLLPDLEFDLVLSLEEDIACARIATLAKTKELSGVFMHNNAITYTESSSHWFDMSMISRFGVEQANQLKMVNLLTYQDAIFRMAGHSFNGEPYNIYRKKGDSNNNKWIGIEKRSGQRWPGKRWWGYDELADLLSAQHIPVRIFEQRANVRDYLDDIDGCWHIVSGDTLAMHAAMAYGKTCTAIFNCTSPAEIYDYGLLRKVVSPLLNEYFYSSSNDPRLIQSVSMTSVYESIPLDLPVSK